MKKGKKHMIFLLSTIVLTVGGLGVFLSKGIDPIQAEESGDASTLASSFDVDSMLDDPTDLGGSTEINEVSSDPASLVSPLADTTQPPYSDDKTYSIWGNPNVDAVPSGTAYKEVSTWTEFNAAMIDSTTTYIKLMADIDNPSTTQGGSTATIISTSKPSLVVDGNGHKLNTQQISYWMTGSTARGYYLKNLTMYGSSPYGCFSTEVYQNKYIVYDNITYEGSQLTAAYYATLVFKGTNTVISANANYTYTINGVTNTVTNNGVATVASGLEAHRAIILEDSITNFITGKGDGLLIGGYLSQNAGNSPYAYLEKNATLNVTSKGDGGESYSYNASSGVVNAGANIQNGGSLILNEGASMTVDVTGTHRAGMRLTGGSSSRNTIVNIGKDAELKIITDERIGQQWETGSVGSTGISNVTAATYPYYSGLTLDSYSKIILSDENAVLDVTMENSRYYRTAALGYVQGIRMAANSSIYVSSKAAFNLNMNGSFGSALKMVGANSSFVVEDEGEVNFDVKSQTGTAYTGTTSLTSINDVSATANILQVDSGSFTVGRKGIFDMKVHDGTGSRNMFYVGNGSFTFADAYRVDLNAQGNDNVELVNMAGTFNADIQAVYAWNKGNSADDKTASNYEWTPIYNAQITYARSGTTDVVANSVSTATKNDFVTNYRTESFNRVLYEWIPDVEVEISEVSDNETILSGQQISGRTNPLAMVTIYITRAGSSTEEKLSGANKANEVDDWASNTSYNYHVNADASGDYTFTLPNDVTLYVGDTIRVHSWRYGKENDATTVVLDKTAPEVVTKDIYRVVNGASPAASEFVSSVTDKGVNPAVWDAYYNAASPQAMIDGWMTTVGVYDVKLDVADRAVDADGNASPNMNPSDVPWEAKLHVLAADREITADDVTTSVAVVRGFNTLDELKEFILAESNAAAFKIENDAKVDLTDQIVVSNLGSLNLNSLDGSYQVEVSVPGENLTKTITVVVEKSESTVTVQFVNELDEELHQEIVLTADIGQSVDLTTTQSVLDAIADVEGRSYVITNRPDSEAGIVVSASGTTVTYKFKGVLELTSAPATVDFGSLTYNAKVQRVDNPTTDDDLVVTDTRADTTDGWTLYAELTENMINVSTGSIMNEALWYVDSSGNEIPLTLDYGSQAVYTSSAGGSFDITSTWGNTSNDPGLKLIADPTKTTVSSVGKYSGVVTWTIMAGQP
ncbi:hypothetical protein I6N96_16965 [Enterococcus sp. BWM-S5]|uniref:WxL domain-containing protein n=1 Tax=Enterococcus larvae TaxID=2794352 RepID=A0ABS4CN22_9ENTE|nr:pectate lyase-like adhesive domain-containing protein [Enterococcus larvae]MBP1047984.1 hypothetical protein [Enterococcus larvae]